MGLGLAEAETETIEVGVVSVMYSRFATGWLRVLLAYVASFGLYVYRSCLFSEAFKGTMTARRAV